MIKLAQSSAADIMSMVDLDTGGGFGGSSSGGTSVTKIEDFTALTTAALNPEHGKDGYLTNSGLTETIFGGSPIKFGNRLGLGLLSDLKPPVEVDCDPEPDYAARIRNSVGLAANRSMSTCTMLNIVASLSNSTDILEGAIAIAGVVHAVKNKDMKTAQGISEALYNITNENSRAVQLLSSSTVGEYIDFGPRAARFNWVMEEALRIGIPSLIDTVIELARDDKERDKILLNQLRQAALRSHLENINKAIDTVGVTKVMTKLPDIIPLILKHYKYRGVRTPLDASNYLTTLLARLNPHWYQVETDDGDYINNVGVFERLSDDAADALLLDSRFVPLVFLGDRYRRMSVERLARQHYGNIPI